MDIWNQAQPYYGNLLASAFGKNYVMIRGSVLYGDYEEGYR